MFKIYCDGGSRGNPGPAASAIVVVEDNSKIFSASKYLGISTNNVAEYTALLMALKYVYDERPGDEVQIILDSQLVTRQMQGKYKVKDAKLLKLFQSAKEIERKLSHVVYSWSAREGNEEADALVNVELDSQVQ